MTTTAPAWDLADRLRKALRHGDVGVGEMAEYLGVERNTVSRYINGHTKADVRTLRLWAMRTGVPYEWLLHGDSAISKRYDPIRSPALAQVA